MYVAEGTIFPEKSGNPDITDAAPDALFQFRASMSANQKPNNIAAKTAAAPYRNKHKDFIKKYRPYHKLHAV